MPSAQKAHQTYTPPKNSPSLRGVGVGPPCSNATVPSFSSVARAGMAPTAAISRRRAGPLASARSSRAAAARLAAVSPYCSSPTPAQRVPWGPSGRPGTAGQTPPPRRRLRRQTPPGHMYSSSSTSSVIGGRAGGPPTVGGRLGGGSYWHSAATMNPELPARCAADGCRNPCCGLCEKSDPKM